MHRRSCRRILVFLAAFLFLAGQAFAASKGLLWEVPGKGCTVWLLGSIHVADASLYPLAPAIGNALASSEFLVVEADITAALSPEAAKLMLKAQYPAGQSLHIDLSDKTFRAFKEQGFDLEKYKGFRPWFVLMHMGQEKLGELGFDPAYGVDLQLITLARQQGKQLKELEGIVQQLKQLQAIADPDPERYMSYMLTDLASLEQDMHTLLDAWKRGDAMQLETQLFRDLKQHPETRPFFDAMFFERDKTMAVKILDYLASGHNHLVVVGSGHLVGPGSIVELLENSGYHPVRR
ncbi:MAG: TraB/GumN family protein [Proteobacteria bacterium]|nr:TraB/GumN family protein [Pseudomonadota bacterium]